jgi:integrase
MSIRISSIYKRKDRRGFWEAKCFIDGRRVRKLFARVDCPTKDAVRESLYEWHRKETEAAASPAVVLPNSAKTVKEAHDDFFYVLDRKLSESTKVNYHLHLDRIVKAFGHVPMKQVSLADLEVWIATYERKGVSPASVNQSIRVLRRFWGWAAARGEVPANVAKGLEWRTEEEKEVVGLLEGEVGKFIEHCSVRFRPIAIFTLYTGLRLSEVINLQWSSIRNDENGRSCIYIVSTRTFKTKTRKKRTIPVHPVVSALLDQLPRQSEYVICNREGEKYAEKSSWFRTAAVRAAEAAGIRRTINMHALRHTFATRVSLYSRDSEAVQRLLGHTKYETTRLYIHPTEQLSQAIEKVPAPPAYLIEVPRKQATILGHHDEKGATLLGATP